MLYNVRVVSSALWGSVFYNSVPNASPETNQIWNVSSISTDRATLKILVLYVPWLVRKLTQRQTDS